MNISCAREATRSRGKLIGMEASKEKKNKLKILITKDK